MTLIWCIPFFLSFFFFFSHTSKLTVECFSPLFLVMGKNPRLSCLTLSMETFMFPSKLVKLVRWVIFLKMILLLGCTCLKQRGWSRLPSNMIGFITLYWLEFVCDADVHSSLYVCWFLLGIFHLTSLSSLSFARSMAFLTCTMKGNASLRTVEVKDTSVGFTCSEPSSWNVCTAGKILCSSVDKDESHALFGG